MEVTHVSQTPCPPVIAKVKPTTVALVTQTKAIYSVVKDQTEVTTVPQSNTFAITPKVDSVVVVPEATTSTLEKIEVKRATPV